MRLNALVLANRRNARRSTGPRTSQGKSRVAKNALRHGLAIPVTIDPAYANEVERLARVIAGQVVDPIRLEGARRVAEAQIDLLRVRRARLALLNDPNAWVKEPKGPSWREKFHALGQLLIILETGKIPSRTLKSFEARCQPPTVAGGLKVLATKLARLDRYERRALSRRKFAIREFDEFPSSGDGQ